MVGPLRKRWGVATIKEKNFFKNFYMFLLPFKNKIILLRLRFLVFFSSGSGSSSKELPPAPAPAHTQAP
jgi:hypothetical protein